MPREALPSALWIDDQSKTASGILEPLLECARRGGWLTEILFDRRESFLDSSDSHDKAFHVLRARQRGVLFVFFGDDFGFSD
jgi:hypothetical protein